jgi:hypothetical protein
VRRLPWAVCAGAIALTPLGAFAQASGAQAGASPATVPGHELTVGAGWYNYVEPGDLSISIHGAKFVGEYTGTFLLDAGAHWFARTNLRAHVGSTSYDGWCGPWQITPDGSSPNGYRLSIGQYSPCDHTGDQDWYLEGRVLAGRDFRGERWTWSPEAGLGVRHLSNGIGGASGYRTDDYLYLPLGLTARTALGSRGVLSLTLEYDHLMRGWQTTYQSKLGGGDAPATPTAPAFTIHGFTDLSFEQHSGRALRASAKYQMNRRWSVEPFWIRWHVGDSTIDRSTATFTVDGIAAEQQLGFYEPRNTTNELGVKLGLRIR